MATWLSESEQESEQKCARDYAGRYIENEPDGSNAADAWRLIASLSFRLGDTLGEVHAFIERAHISSVPFYDLSNTTNKFNGYVNQHRLICDIEERRNLARRLLEAMLSRRSEASATDLSRMAWLALNCGDKEPLAKELVTAGLQLEPDNEYCARLNQKLDGISYYQHS